MSLAEVGKQCGITRQAVRDRLMRAGVARRPQTKLTGENIKKEDLEKLYFEDKLPLPKIATEFSVCIEIIYRMLKIYQIPKRPNLEKGGRTVDFLRSLQINEQGIYECREEQKYPYLHQRAKIIGIKIKIRKITDRKFAVTRIG